MVFHSFFVIGSLLNISSVSKWFEDKVALNEVSLNLKKNSIHGLIGHNGAGKTTLLRIITQIIKPDAGQIEFDGETINAKHKYQIGYMPEERGVYTRMSIIDYLTFIAKIHRMHSSEYKPVLQEWLDRMGLLEVQKKELKQLSKGMQQKVQFIATVFFEPSLLILDEPFSGFDPSNVELVKREILRLNNLGTTILFSTHQMEAVEDLCEEVTMIHESKVLKNGSIQELKTEFDTGSYLLDYQGEFSLESIQYAKKDNRYLIQLADAQKGDFLKSLNAEKIVSFSKYQPTLREIFLQLVNE